MRIIFECYAIYSALICTVLTLVLSFGASDDSVEWIAKKVVNTSFLLYGPILTVLCVYGMFDIKALSKICTVHGISAHTNYVNLFVLISTLCFSLAVTFMMAMEKTLDMAQHTFTNENTLLYRIS